MEVSDTRHLLRRLCFASTPSDEARLLGLDAAAAFAALWSAERAVPLPATPEFLSVPWTNAALHYASLTPAEYESRRAAQAAVQRARTERLTLAWIEQLALGPAPLRENLTLFLHSLFGSSSAAVEIPEALEGRNALLRRTCMMSVPDILERLVLDPAMMIQIGMDGHGPDRVSDRPAKLILEHWTVGAGGYSNADVGELSRALTGWTLAGDGGEPDSEPLGEDSACNQSRAGRSWASWPRLPYCRTCSCSGRSVRATVSAMTAPSSSSCGCSAAMTA